MAIEHSLTGGTSKIDVKALAQRAGLLALLAACQIPLLAFLFDPFAVNAADAAWLQARAILRELVPGLLIFLVAFALLLSVRVRAFATEWADAARTHAWRPWLALNLALFVCLLIATPLLNRPAPGAPPWAFFIGWSAGAVIMTAALAAAAAPIPWWRQFAAREWAHIALAAGATGLILAAFILSRQSWSMLSAATFHYSAALLRLYEADVFVDAERFRLGAAGFRVSVAAACSGYEGIGLVTAFVALYLWCFRRELRFPNALLLLPIGIAAIWLLNGARIAALISIGAHFSRDVALNGFHSQAGWMMFLIVTIGLMLASHQSAFFRASAQKGRPLTEAGRLAVALLLPFLAATAAGIVAAAFSAGGDPFYPLKVAAGAGALYVCRRAYKRGDFAPDTASIVLGLIVGAVWIATEPDRSAPTEVKAWFDTLPPALAGLWLAARIAGTVIVAPIAEELAFRGYLHRKLQARHVEDASAARFTLLAFIVTSLLFGAIHGRWVSGALAGAVFALALYRSGRLGGAIWSHASANALIALWAIVFDEWALL